MCDGARAGEEMSHRSGWHSRGLAVFLALFISFPALVACDNDQEREARYQARGQALLAEGKLAKAQIEFRNALQIDPTNGDNLYSLGLVAETRGEYGPAYRW